MDKLRTESEAYGRWPAPQNIYLHITIIWLLWHRDSMLRKKLYENSANWMIIGSTIILSTETNLLLLHLQPLVIKYPGSLLDSRHVIIHETTSNYNHYAANTFMLSIVSELCAVIYTNFILDRILVTKIKCIIFFSLQVLLYK